jgi:hydrogenase expression/formation protein HypD
LNSLEQKLKDPDLCQSIVKTIRQELKGELRFMEVCGTHTVSIFQSGIRSLLPAEIIHLSGPGCPVCVTHEREVAAFLELAERKDVIVATFGDLMRVPGPNKRNLKAAQAEGARIKVVYSPFDAVKLARENPGDKVVFLGVGFETTAPTIAATIRIAREQGVNNFLVLSFHKLVPPVMRVLVEDPELAVNAFMLPGHVCMVSGLEPYRFLADKHGIPCVVTGFEPVDILRSILTFVRMRNAGEAVVKNGYGRAVADLGNTKAQEIMNEVFESEDALFRGIGSIPAAGLGIREEYGVFDAMRVLGLSLPDVPPLAGCRCGDVLRGKIRPDECPLFKKVCTPANPVGPCMVSTEGSCAAYYKYQI